jgi:hypothetical protein
MPSLLNPDFKVQLHALFETLRIKKGTPVLKWQSNKPGITAADYRMMLTTLEGNPLCPKEWFNITSKPSNPNHVFQIGVKSLYTFHTTHIRRLTVAKMSKKRRASIAAYNKKAHKLKSDDLRVRTKKAIDDSKHNFTDHLAESEMARLVDEAIHWLGLDRPWETAEGPGKQIRETAEGSVSHVFVGAHTNAEDPLEAGRTRSGNGRVLGRHIQADEMWSKCPAAQWRICSLQDRPSAH